MRKKYRHSVYLSPQAERVVVELSELYSVSQLVDLALRQYWRELCELTYLKDYKHLLEVKIGQLEDQVDKLDGL